MSVCHWCVQVLNIPSCRSSCVLLATIVLLLTVICQTLIISFWMCLLMSGQIVERVNHYKRYLTVLIFYTCRFVCRPLGKDKQHNEEEGYYYLSFLLSLFFTLFHTHKHKAEDVLLFFLGPSSISIGITITYRIYGNTKKVSKKQ